MLGKTAALINKRLRYFTILKNDYPEIDDDITVAVKVAEVELPIL